MRTPVGTIEFNFPSDQLTDPRSQGGIIFQEAAGGHVFRLERTANLQLNFYHSSPGTGTRLATIDLNSVPPSTTAHIAFTWSPAEIRLYYAPLIPGCQMATAIGEPSTLDLRVGTDGIIYQLGGQGVEVKSVSFYKRGKPILQQTTLQRWQETTRATEILLTGTSDQGHEFEIVIANMVLAVLVTGLETYAKARFLELEQEGIPPLVDRIIEAFFSTLERDAGIHKILEQESITRHVSTLANIVERGAINFQNYESCKRAFNKAYGIKFGDIGLKSENLNRLQQLINYRHRVIHVSPLLNMLNQPDVPPANPEFANKALAQGAVNCFDEFVTKLHKFTLTLRRSH